ncbi:hypothetical protein AUG19_07565 [archaeon 13_1_20CM_2_54_9]|nr:MAG: hypothetical protein AUJ07_09900 [Crenarchaeota archaeon 13_1_40CM_3_53_5]OLE74777.1 MAG: hypothetical protein AUG19_07565 [archaeon 13_1_20CM_2_54_9]
MASETRQHYAKFIVLAGLILTGIVLIALPTPVEQNVQVFSAPQVTTNELPASIGFAPPGYYADAHVTTNNAVTVKLVLVGSAVLFSQSFPGGTFDIPRVQIIGGGNLFLTISSTNGAFTQMNVFARIFHDVSTYQYAWIGIGVLGVAGLLTLAILRPETGLGRLVYKILPVIGRY